MLLVSPSLFDTECFPKASTAIPLYQQFSISDILVLPWYVTGISLQAFGFWGTVTCRALKKE